MRSDYDIIIAGASVAGASSAIALAPAGYRILLLDRAVFPRDKPCGEGLMPGGVRLLAELGVLAAVLAHPGTKRFRGIRYRNRRSIWAEADFPGAGAEGSFGIVLRRRYLDHLLLERAKSFSNVTVREGFRVAEPLMDGGTVTGVAGYQLGASGRREAFAAPLTLGTDGRHSLFHTACDLGRCYLPRRRFGVTGHLMGVTGVGPYVEVLLHPHGEIYLAPCGEGLSLAAILVEAPVMRIFGADLRDTYLSFLQAPGGLGERARAAEVVDPVLAVGPLGFTVEHCYRPGLLLVGDSAGFLDPITGEGMTVALRSIQAAVPLIHRAFAVGRWDDDLGRHYAAVRRECLEDVLRLTKLVLGLSRHRLFADRAIRGLSRDTPLFQKLLGVAAGTHGYADVSLADKSILLLKGLMPRRRAGPSSTTPSPRR